LENPGRTQFTIALALEDPGRLQQFLQGGNIKGKSLIHTTILSKDALGTTLAAHATPQIPALPKSITLEPQSYFHWASSVKAGDIEGKSLIRTTKPARALCTWDSRAGTREAAAVHKSRLRNPDRSDNERSSVDGGSDYK
jgi:hypothetical protein